MKRTLASLVTVLCLGLIGCRPGEQAYTIGVMQMVTHPALDAIRDGFVEALADAGYVDGERVDVQFESAEGDMATIQLIAQGFVSQRVDMIVPIGTPPLQAALEASPSSTPIVFSGVSDPYSAGAGTSADDHLPNVTGTLDLSPVAAGIDAIRELLPTARAIGVLYDAGEQNSRSEARALAAAAEAAGLTVVAQTVAGSSEVLQGAQALARRDIDLFCHIPDYATTTAFDSLLSVSREAGIPLVSVVIEDAEAGAVLSLGWDYFSEGYAAGRLAVRVMEGESPGDIPFQPPDTTLLHVNLGAAEAYGLTLPASLIERADRVIE